MSAVATVLARLYARGFLPEVWIPDKATLGIRWQATQCAGPATAGAAEGQSCPGFTRRPQGPGRLFGRSGGVAAFGVSLILAGPADAGPFDRAPRDDGPAVNRRLDEAGSGLRLTFEGCRSMAECRFSSANMGVVATGRARPPRTQGITISTDLLRDQAGVDPADLVGDVSRVFGATIAEFDPRLRPDWRADVVSDLIGTALHLGHSEQDGAEAHYALRFDEGSDGLLVIAVTPLR